MLDRETTRLRVARVVHSLDEPYRTAIICRYFENMLPREIAARLDISVAAVESRLRRGLQKLRARLDRDFGDRKTWCTALLPLTVSTVSEAAAATATSAITGALIMSMKLKIGIAIVLAFGVTYAFWPRDEVKPPEVEVSGPTPPIAEKREGAEPTPMNKAESVVEVVEKKPGAKPSTISLEPARGSIVGVVTDQNGAPIPEAMVRALRFKPLQIDLDELARTRTDKAGRFVLKPIRVRCAVEASARGHYAERRLASPFSRVDFTLGQPGILRGTVIRPRGKSPVVGASVAVYRWQPADPFERNHKAYALSRPPIATARTNEAGDYRFGSLCPGDYQLRVLPRSGPQKHTRREGIRVRGGEETVKNLCLGTSIKISGRVTDEESGEPIEGVQVTASLHHRTVTDADGRFEIPEYERNASGDGFWFTADGYYPTSRPPGWDSRALVRIWNVKMRKAAVVRGRVIGPGGPLIGARVSGSWRLVQLPSWRVPFPSSTTDDKGAFEVIMPTGKGRLQRVYAVKEGYAWGSSEELDPRPGETITGIVVRLGRGGAVSGRVTDADGKPVDAARVSLWSRHVFGGTLLVRRKSVFTRADGRYDLDGVPPGNYELRVLPRGALDTGSSPLSGVIHSSVAVTARAAVNVDLVLPRGPVITGRVVDTNGRPVPDVVITGMANVPKRLDGESPPHHRRALTDAEGRFRLEGLWSVEQTYWLRALKFGYNAESLRDVLPGGPEVLFTLKALNEIHGRVVDGATGEPVPEFQILGRPQPGPGGEKPRITRLSRPFDHFTDPDGGFTLTLRPGAYSFEARSVDGRRSDRLTFEVPMFGEAPPLELRVWQGAAVRGIVRTPDGEPPKYGDVSLFLLDKRPVAHARKVSVDSDGRFAARGLAAGTYLIYAEAVGVDERRLAATERVVLQAGAEPDVRLDVDPGAEVYVEVTAGNREPLRGAKVTIERADGVPVAMELSRHKFHWTWLNRQIGKKKSSSVEASVKAQRKALERLTITGDDGKLVPLTLTRADYVISATAPGYAPYRKSVRITSGGKQTVEIRLKKE